MTSQRPSYRGYRFPPEIISHAVWLLDHTKNWYLWVIGCRGRGPRD